MADAFRSSIESEVTSRLISQVLLDYAVQFVAGQRGLGSAQDEEPEEPGILPSIYSGLEHRLLERGIPPIAEILSREADWLATHQELLSWYGSELLRIMPVQPWSGHAESLTSRALESVVSCVVRALLPDKSDSLSAFDPTCGMGTLLNAVADLAENRVRLCGQDLNYDTARWAAQNLFIAGRDATIRPGDTLVTDAFPGETYDIVVSDAPHGLSWIQQEQKAMKRFRYIPPRNDSTILFMQALLAKIKPIEQGGGLGIFFSAVKPLKSIGQGYPEIREMISDTDVLHSIIALPRDLNAVTSIDLFALVFSTRKDISWRGKTKFIDLRGQYEDNPQGPERRRLKTSALEDLTREIASTRDSAIGRLVPSSRLSYKRLSLERPSASHASEPEVVGKAKYDIMLPAQANISEWLTNRYSLGLPPQATESDTRQTIWDIDRIFSSRDEKELRKSLMDTGWPTTRLSAFVDRFQYVRSASAPERAEQVTGLAGGNSLIIPVDKGHDVTAGDPEDVLTRHRCIVLDLLPGLDTGFVAGWLNSSTGRLARIVAAAAVGFKDSPRTVSHNEAWTFVDEIIVPVPTPSDQDEFAIAHASIAAGHQRLRELDESMWRTPSTISEARRAAGKLLTTGSLDEWFQTLPYPMAAALATVLSERHPDAQQYEHFWEATAIFLASYLLGALKQDESLWQTEVSTLIESLKGSGSSFERATFGTWKITIELLAKRFRAGLNSPDPDERARHSQSLGNPSRDFIERIILSTEIIQLLNEALPVRNLKLGHGGASSRRHRKDQREFWETLTGHLRDAIGSSFSDFTLVRPGLMRYDGTKFLNYATSLTGPQTPFRPITVSTTRAIVIPDNYPNYLCLVSTSGDYTPLVPFIRIGSEEPGEEPDDADYICYFYNRRERENGQLTKKFRFIPYQLAPQDEIIREYPEVLGLVEALTPGAEQRNDPPD